MKQLRGNENDLTQFSFMKCKKVIVGLPYHGTLDTSLPRYKSNSGDAKVGD